MYSEYRGITFLEEYIYSRQRYLDKVASSLQKYNFEYMTLTSSSPVKRSLMEIREKLRAGNFNNKTIDLVNAYTKTFEVRKRIYQEYDKNWKPLNGSEFEDHETYLLFADCLLVVFQHTKCLKYFSCLLKLDDTLLSIQSGLNERLQEFLKEIIMQEIKIFYQLVDENGIVLEEAK